MTRYTLRIITDSPVLLADGPPAGNVTTTLDFIPGTVLRGVLARRYLDKGGSPKDTEFMGLFLSHRTFFDHAFVNGATVIPLSARTCKYEGGFVETHNAHGVTDIVLSGSAELRCPVDECGEQLDYFEGFYHDELREKPVYRRDKVSRRVINRTAILNRTATAAIGQLYSQEVIDEGQVFFTCVSVPDNLKTVVERLTERPFDAHIGRGRSRGQGWVRIARIADQAKAAMPEVTSRALQFKDSEGRPLLVVTLLTEAIFRDRYLRDISLPTIDHLCHIGIKKEEWEPVPSDAYADTRLIFGFDGWPLNLPRIPRLAVQAGSVVVFAAKDGVTKPQYPGGDGNIRIGENTVSGFGRAILWHPFHLQFQPIKEA